MRFDEYKTVILTDLEVQEVVRSLLMANVSKGKAPPAYIMDLVERIIEDSGNKGRVITEDYHIVMQRRVA